MPAGSFTVFDIAKTKLLTGIHDVDTHVFKIALVTSSQTFTAAFAGTSTDARYADITAQVANGAGYTTGGITLTMVVTRSVATVTVDSSVDPAWTTATITAKWGIVYNDTATNKDMLGFVDLETGGGSISSTSGTFQITWNAAGLFTLT
jgi:hypothetical protein